MLDYGEIVARVEAGGSIDVATALEVLRTPAEDVVSLVAAVARLRRAHFGDRVRLNYLVDLKSGLCQEDCGYCSQALGATTPILRYGWLSTREAVDQARAGIAGGAARVCLVASGRGPMRRDVERVCDITAAIKSENPGIEVCACLGLLRDGQAERLADAGIDAYNHNVNTAASFHDEIVTTHTYDDRVTTISRVGAAGVSQCSGLIVGMGETDAQVVEALGALRDLGVDSIPINFLVPFDGTRMQGRDSLTPSRCLTIVALARLLCPEKEIRLAGGRELHLRSLQGLALHVANSIFLGDYLTAEGQAAEQDLEMIRDHGFVVEAPKPAAPEAIRPRTPSVRRRGAGTQEPPNA